VTAPSAWGRIVDDVVTRVCAITPTASSTKRWHHIRDSKVTTEEQAGGSAFRQFSTLELQTSEPVRVHGGGERQEDFTLVLLVTYPRMDGIQGLVAADYVDLTRALAPTSTYSAVRVAGVVTLCTRSVAPPDGPHDADYGLEVKFQVRCIFRHPVTLV
jgi:hypothetical protein